MSYHKNATKELYSQDRVVPTAYERRGYSELDSERHGSLAVSTENEQQPSPPKPAKSAFMCFSAAKEASMKENLGENRTKKDMIKTVAEAWRALSSRERARWDEEARNDKLRYMKEKAEYKGPWEIPKRRAKKHPLAPKRPMSAFLKYSQTRRGAVKRENPDMSNTDVSRLLGEMWRNASHRERAPYIEREEKERAVYKAAVAKWRADQAALDSAISAAKVSTTGGSPPTQERSYVHDNFCYPDSPDHLQGNSPTASSSTFFTPPNHQTQDRSNRRSYPRYIYPRTSSPINYSDSEAADGATSSAMYAPASTAHASSPRSTGLYHTPLPYSPGSRDYGSHLPEYHQRRTSSGFAIPPPLPPPQMRDDSSHHHSYYHSPNDRYYARYP